jgi:hypothetical protein
MGVAPWRKSRRNYWLSGWRVEWQDEGGRQQGRRRRRGLRRNQGKSGLRRLNRRRLGFLVMGGTRGPAFAVQMGSLEGCEGQLRPFQEGSQNSLDSLAHRWRRGGFVAQEGVKGIGKSAPEAEYR